MKIYLYINSSAKIKVKIMHQYCIYKNQARDLNFNINYILACFILLNDLISVSFNKKLPISLINSLFNLTITLKS
jgi:hypothetical protein